MPHKIELAPTGRATCRGCKRGIEKGVFRFAEEFQNPYAEEGGASFRYWHLPCAATKLANELRDALAAYDAGGSGGEAGAGPVPDRAALEEAIAGNVRPTMPFAERAAAGRARCRGCDVTIKKGELRVAFEREFEGPMGPQKGAAYCHAACLDRFLERERERDRAPPDRDEIVRRVLANSRLAGEDLEAVRRALAPPAQAP